VQVCIRTPSVHYSFAQEHRWQDFVTGGLRASVLPARRRARGPSADPHWGLNPRLPAHMLIEHKTPPNCRHAAQETRNLPLRKLDAILSPPCSLLRFLPAVTRERFDPDTEKWLAVRFFFILYTGLQVSLSTLTICIAPGSVPIHDNRKGRYVAPANSRRGD